MQTQNPFLDQLARLATEAAGAANTVREETETLMRRQFERLIADMDLVPREEFEMVREMAAAARLENEALKARLEDLEAKVSGRVERADP